MYRFCNALASEGLPSALPSASITARVGAAENAALLLLDRTRRLLSMSPGAELLIDDSPLEILFGALTAREQSLARQIDIALRDAGSCTLSLGEHELQFVPLHGSDGATQVIATLRRLGHARGQQLDRAASRFGLTHAETRLLATLCGGASLTQASERLGVARTTARTHLQRIFDKSGTHRQAELVGMVLAA